MTTLMFILMLAGIVLAFAGVLILRVALRADELGSEETFSEELVHTDSGAFVEHGMVRSDDRRNVKPQSKRSKSFLDAVA